MQKLPFGRWGALLLALLVFSIGPSHADPELETERPRAPESSPSAGETAEPEASAADSSLLPTDPALQKRLERAVANRPRWARLAEERVFALGVVDLSDLDRPRYAAVNSREMIYAASLPKIGILLAAEHQLEAGTLSMTPAVKRDLNAMIRVSSNAAATRMINRVGGLAAVNTVLTDPRYQFYDETNGGGLWVGKRYASDRRRNRDPIEGLSHAANVHEVCRFYTLLAQRRLISEARSEQMLEILDDPGLSHKFVGSLEQRAPGAEVYRKSGSWRRWHADSALVWGPQRRYVVVALVKDPRGARIVRSVIPAVEGLLGITPDTAGKGTQ